MNPIIPIAGVGAVALLAFSGDAQASAPAIQYPDPTENWYDPFFSSDDTPLIDYSMPTQSQSIDPSVQLASFLYLIRLAESGDRYNVMQGGATFSSYADHPSFTMNYVTTNNSHPAGAYQIQPGTWKEAQAALGLPDFSPDSQDAAAVYLIKRRGAYDNVLAGSLQIAAQQLAQEWVIFQSKPYSWVASTFENNGGTLA